MTGVGKRGRGPPSPRSTIARRGRADRPTCPQCGFVDKASNVAAGPKLAKS